MIVTATKNICFELEENEARNITQITETLQKVLDTIIGEDYDTTYEVSKKIRDLIRVCVALDDYI